MIDPRKEVPLGTGSTMALPNSRCVILVPVAHHIERDCEVGLVELEKRGYVVQRVRGYSAVDLARSQMATDAVRDDFEETFWIDSDIAFHPDDVDKVRSHDLPICVGIYPKKGKRELAVHVIPGTRSIKFGNSGGLIELLYAGCGFMHVRKHVYETITQSLALPICNVRFGRPLIPFFQPLIVPTSEGAWYLAEDFAFCERARQCGLRVMADSSLRLFHIGGYGYGWEDAGTDIKRYSSYEYHVTDFGANDNPQ